MNFGLIPVNVGVKSVEHIVGLAQLAESVGIESVWTFEHVMVPAISQGIRKAASYIVYKWHVCCHSGHIRTFTAEPKAPPRSR